MSRDQAVAQIKAAAWTAAAAVGHQEAAQILERIASEIRDALWERPGNR